MQLTRMLSLPCFTARVMSASNHGRFATFGHDAVQSFPGSLGDAVHQKHLGALPGKANGSGFACPHTRTTRACASNDGNPPYQPWPCQAVAFYPAWFLPGSNWTSTL